MARRQCGTCALPAQVRAKLDRELAAGWSPKERCGPLGLTIWANPETGFYSPQESALHRLNEWNEQ